jgi:hypothetical protein
MTELARASDGPYLGLYLLTLAVHAAFVSYLVGGALFVVLERLSRRTSGAGAALSPAAALAAAVTSWLPLSMGAAITAGVAPLLFVQVLYQRPFYTANLLLGPLWGAMIPALVLGFYLLYLHKARPQLRPVLLLAIALACFLFVAALWSQNHHVMTTPESWAQAYEHSAAGVYGASFARRLPLWIGGMLAQFALLAAWQASALAPAGAAAPSPAGEDARGTARLTRALAALALGGRALSALGAALLGWHRAPWSALTLALLGAAAIDCALWLATARAGALRPALLRALSCTSAAALVLAVAVREQARLPALRQLPPPVTDAGGRWLFLLFALLAAGALVAIVRAVRRALRETT